MPVAKPIKSIFNDPDYVSPEIVERYKKAFDKISPQDADRMTDEAIAWFRKRISKDTKANKQNLLLKQDIYRKKTGTENSQLIGKLYFYEYRAEQAGDKETGLYDKYPMTFFFDSYRSKDNHTILLGLNLHYLTPREREHILRDLLVTKSSNKIRPQTRLKISWDIIKSVVSNKSLALRAVHAYRIDRFQSRLIEIPAQDWSICVFLSLQKFVHIEGKTVSEVEARKHIRKKV